MKNKKLRDGLLFIPKNVYVLLRYISSLLLALLLLFIFIYSRFGKLKYVFSKKLQDILNQNNTIIITEQKI